MKNYILFVSLYVLKKKKLFKPTLADNWILSSTIIKMYKNQWLYHTLYKQQIAFVIYIIFNV